MDKDDLAPIRAITEDAGADSWTCRTGCFHRAEVSEEGTPYTDGGIINNEDWRVVNCPNGIDALGELGERGGAAAKAKQADEV